VSLHGWGDLLVGGHGLDSLYGKTLRCRKLPENAATSTTTPAWFAKQITCGASVAPALFAGDGVHAVLGAFIFSLNHCLNLLP